MAETGGPLPEAVLSYLLVSSGDRPIGSFPEGQATEKGAVLGPEYSTEANPFPGFVKTVYPVVQGQVTPQSTLIS